MFSSMLVSCLTPHYIHLSLLFLFWGGLKERFFFHLYISLWFPQISTNLLSECISFWLSKHRPHSLVPLYSPCVHLALGALWRFYDFSFFPLLHQADGWSRSICGSGLDTLPVMRASPLDTPVAPIPAILAAVIPGMRVEAGARSPSVCLCTHVSRWACLPGSTRLHVLTHGWALLLFCVCVSVFLLLWPGKMSHCFILLLAFIPPAWSLWVVYC